MRGMVKLSVVHLQLTYDQIIYCFIRSIYEGYCWYFVEQMNSLVYAPVRFLSMQRGCKPYGPLAGVKLLTLYGCVPPGRVGRLKSYYFSSAIWFPRSFSFSENVNCESEIG